MILKWGLNTYLFTVYGILDLQREDGRVISITTSLHSNTRDIPIRQHFQVTYGTGKVLQVKLLT